jgi:hypothetical protein
MKTIDEVSTGLPSSETEWPKNPETERESTREAKRWVSSRLQHMLQSSIRESTWRGFQGYDSPLAG